MPIITPWDPEFDLEGRNVYASDLPAVAAILGSPSVCEFWTNFSMTTLREAPNYDRVKERDVVGFRIVGPNGTLHIRRRADIHGGKHTATLAARDEMIPGAVRAVMPPLRLVWPWAAHRCRFVPRDRRELPPWLVWTGAVAAVLGGAVTIGRLVF